MAADEERSYVLGRLILDYIRTFMWPAVVLLAVVIYQDDLMGIVEKRQVKAFGFELGPAVEQLQQVEAATQQELDDIAGLVETLQANYKTLQTNYERELAAVIEQARAENGLVDLGDLANLGDLGSIEGIADALAVTADIDTKITSLSQNLDREVQQIQQIQQTATRAPIPQPQAPLQQQQQQQQQEAAPAPPLPATRAEQAAAFERAGFEALLARDFDAALEAFTEARRTWPTYHNVAEIQRRLAQLKRKEVPLDDAKWAEIDRAILTEFSWGMPPDIRAKFRALADEAYGFGAVRG